MAHNPEIVNRLTRHLKARGVENASDVADGILKKFGILNSSGKLTKKGKVRNAMTPAQRARTRKR